MPLKYFSYLCTIDAQGPWRTSSGLLPESAPTILKYNEKPTDNMKEIIYKQPICKQVKLAMEKHAFQAVSYGIEGAAGGYNSDIDNIYDTAF